MPHEFKDQKIVNKIACSLSGKSHLVATNDCHYVHADDSESHEVLLAMQTQAKWADKSRFRFSTRGLFLCSEKQMRYKFLKQGILSLKQIDEAINSTIEIADKCNFTIDKQNIFLPIVPKYKDKDLETILINNCLANFKKIFGVSIRGEFWKRYGNLQNTK
jgi:DNA polymerase-3 subunit alpha